MVRMVLPCGLAALIAQEFRQGSSVDVYYYREGTVVPTLIGALICAIVPAVLVEWNTRKMLAKEWARARALPDVVDLMPADMVFTPARVAAALQGVAAHLRARAGSHS